MLRKLVSTAVVAVALTIAVPAMAQAAALTLVDGAGDMWEWSADTETRAPRQHRTDINRVTLHHTTGAIQVRSDFAELQRAGSFSVLWVRLRTNTGMFRVASLSLGSASTRGWRGDVRLTNRNADPVKCRVDHSVDYAANVAHMRIPRSCLNDPRWVQVRVGSTYVQSEPYPFYTDNAHDHTKWTNAWSRRIRGG